VGCGNVTNVAAAIGATMVATSAPAATGGAISDGTYHLVNLVVFTGAGGSSGPLALSVKQTIVIHGSTADAVTDANGTIEQATASIAPAGTAVTYTPTCPKPDVALSGGFSATASSLVLYLVNDAGQTVSYTYAK
jgi:hypothetical protein